MPAGKIRPNFCPNRPLPGFVVGGEFPKAESVIHRLQNPRKMAFPINRPKSVMVRTPLESGKICPGYFSPESVFNRLIRP
ncbi:unnamed protein product [Linum trigynum]|uniref:Uncharacterized protein n=1 Tax=Linum trigynum TaxID=586398 RepID=A0AAV2FGD7_9ROSI